MSSCEKDFLDLKPISSVAASNFYQTADDVRNAVNGCYASLQSGGISVNDYVFNEVRSDNTIPVASGSVTDQDEFDRFYIRTTNPFIAAKWNDSYKAIARFNKLLNRIGDIQMNEDVKKRNIGEVKFLRAYIYFNLVRTFGDVPLVLKEITSAEEGYAYGRNAAADVYKQIEQDLADAEPVLPDSYTGTDVGRATKGAAKALSGKVFLTQKKYTDAAAKLKEVIDGGLYTLLANYADIFKPTGKNHKESVFDVQFASGGVGEGNPWPNYFAPTNSGNAVIPFGGDANSQPTADIIAAYEPNDLRKNISLATSYKDANGQTIPFNFVKKFMDVPTTKYDNGNNIPVIRYADVLLMYAECLNEAGFVPDGEAFSYLNKVRTRAGLPDKTGVDIPTQQDFRLAIEQERRVEFAFEGHRWYDLVRTGRAIALMNGKKSQIGLVKDLTQTDLLFPIPQSQIDINKEKMTQNPGY